MTLIETYIGIKIYEKQDLVGGKYYYAPDLTTFKATVNFAPTIKTMRKFINDELLHTNNHPQH